MIDDPISMIRCTNKVFLMELLQQNQVPTPPTVILAEDTDLTKVIELGLNRARLPTHRRRAVVGLTRRTSSQRFARLARRSSTSGR